MLPAINLDHEFLLDADKVQNVAIIGMLPAELAAIELPKAEGSPELSFRIGYVLSERTMQMVIPDMLVRLALHE